MTDDAGDHEQGGAMMVFIFAVFLVEFALDEGYTISFSMRTLSLELL